MAEKLRSPYHGFRKFVQAKAMEIGITGSIQRYHHSDVRMRYEGTASQIEQFIAFLNLCRRQGLIDAVDQVSSTRAEKRRFHDFLIDRDFSCTLVNGGMVLADAYSDGDEYDMVSTYSVDLLDQKKGARETREVDFFSFSPVDAVGRICLLSPLLLSSHTFSHHLPN
jgi:acylphosphatase